MGARFEAVWSTAPPSGGYKQHTHTHAPVQPLRRRGDLVSNGLTRVVGDHGSAGQSSSSTACLPDCAPDRRWSRRVDTSLGSSRRKGDLAHHVHGVDQCCCPSRPSARVTTGQGGHSPRAGAEDADGPIDRTLSRNNSSPAKPSEQNRSPPCPLPRQVTEQDRASLPTAPSPSATSALLLPVELLERVSGPRRALDPSSTEEVGALSEEIAAEEQAKNGPWINTTSYSVPVYTVSANQPTVSVSLENHAPDAALSSAWSAVPLPADAQPAAGSDARARRLAAEHRPAVGILEALASRRRLACVLGWRDAARLLESRRLRAGSLAGRQAVVGGRRLFAVAPRRADLPGRSQAGSDRPRSLDGDPRRSCRRLCRHLRIARTGTPATRSRCPREPICDWIPNLDLAALHLPRLTFEIAEAAQRYGIFITDRAPNVTFQAQDPTPTGSNPYAGPGGYFEGKHPASSWPPFPGAGCRC